MKRLINKNLKYHDAKKISENNKNSLYLLPIILILSVLPLITRYVTYNPKLSEFYWFGNKELTSDLFLLYKQVFLIIVSLFALVLLILNYKQYKADNIPKYIYLLIGYNILLLASTLLSPYRYWGIVGVFEHFESIFVHLSYFILFIYILIFIKKQEQIDIILRYFIISFIVLMIIGVSQALGMDLLSSNIFTMLIFPLDIWSNLNKFSMDFLPGTVYLTQYNPNYAGVYLALTIPIITAMIFYFKNKYAKVGCCILWFIAIYNLVMTKSEAGIITVILCAIIGVIFLRKKLFKNQKIFYFLLGISLCFALIIGLTNIGKIKSMLFNTENKMKLEKILTEDKLTITYLSKTAEIDYSIEDGYYNFHITDKNGNNVEYYHYMDEGYYIFEIPGWENLKMQTGLYNDMYSIMFNIDGQEWYFTNQNGDETFYYINSNSRLVKIIDAEYAFNKRYDGLATRRGFIWSRTIPLLKDSILLGSGADSFIFRYPHNDYTALMNIGFGSQVINKPHNLYLQIAVHSGLLSLFLYIGFFVFYIIYGFRMYWNLSMDKWNHIIGLAFFLSSLSYLFISLTNDSFITVTPIFWCVVGLSLSVNRINNGLNNHK